MQKKISLVIILFFSLINFSCDLFNTRTPETASGTRSTYSFPDRPSVLISNFTNAIVEKDAQNYQLSFTDSSYTPRVFQFLPSQGAVTQYPAFLNGWTVKSEQQYLSNVISKLGNDRLMLTLTEAKYTLFLPDSANYLANYSIELPTRSGMSQLKYVGQINLSLVCDNRSKWVVGTWADYKTGSLPSWSDLKGLSY